MVADFPKCSSIEFEDFTVPHHLNAESRPRAPTTFYNWKRQAENLADVFSLVYGLEHRVHMQQAIDTHGLQADMSLVALSYEARTGARIRP